MSNTAEQGMLYRTLGGTGEKISEIGIGGWHIGLSGLDEPLSIHIICTAVDHGVNFMDNCRDTTREPVRSAWTKRYATATSIGL